MGKRIIEKSEKVGLRLTAAERTLILEEPIHIHVKLAEPIRSTPNNAPVMLTLDELEDLAGYIAAEANHSTDKKLRKKLDTIFFRIQGMLETHTDVEPPKSLKIEDAKREKLLAEQTVELAEWAAKMLIGAEQLGIKTKPVARFPLPDAERAVLMMTPTIDEEIQRKLAEKNPRLTVGEVGGLLMAVAEAMIDAPPLQCVALITTAKSLMNCLETEVTGVLKPAESKGTFSMIYRLKITLADAKPAIWRRVEVPDCTLGELHEVFQCAMGWQNSHLHQFIVNGKYFGEAMTDDLDLEIEDEDGIRISQVFTGKKKLRIVYEYDFGDSWQHDIVLEKTLEPEPKVKYPRCVEGARACPPEDCGGIGGYADFLEAISDPKHPDHRDMMEWIGGKFDPEKFSVETVNRELKNLR
jgi:Plasmid pRiA4b ORF-3-like protein